MMSKHTGLNPRSRAPAPARCPAGDPVTPFEHNWILQFNPNNKLCGASLIDAEWAVTAAHCTEGIDASNMKVHVYRHRIRGGDGHECSETLNIDKKFEHHAFDSARLWNDIALLRLSQVHQPPLSRPQKLPTSSPLRPGYPFGLAALCGEGRMRAGRAHVTRPSPRPRPSAKPQARGSALLLSSRTAAPQAPGVSSTLSWSGVSLRRPYCPRPRALWSR